MLTNGKLCFIFFLFPIIFFSQNNRYESFFKEIDSTKSEVLALQNLQNFKKAHLLNFHENVIFYEKVITLSQNLQKYDLELKYAFEGVNFAKSVKIDSLVSFYTMKIGSAYYLLNERETAKKYFYSAYLIAKKCNNWSQEAKTLNNLGAIYIENKDFKNAEKNLLKAIEIFKAKNQLFTNGLLTLRLLATLYTEQKKYDKAEKIYLETLKEAEFNRDTTLLCYTLIYYSKLLSDKGDNNKAIIIAEKANEFQEIYQNNTTKILVFRGLTNIYSKTKNFNKAIEFYEKLLSINKIVYSEDLEKKVAENEVKYKTAQILHQKEIAESLAKSEKRKNQFYIVLFVSVLVLLFILFLVFYFMQKAKKRKEELLIQQQLLESIIKAQEDEKMRIARDLHDGICQKFAATKIKFSTVSIENEKELIKFINAISLLDESTNELRSISHEIMPPALNQNDLINAIKNLAQNSFPNEIKFSFEVFGNPFLFTENEQINIYRILQEIISNIIKHAMATEVSIQLLFSENNFCVVVEDDGVGIEIDRLNGIGLKNIKIRADIIQAKLEFEKGVNKGTIVTLNLNKKGKFV
jgi:two-component system, NarL family, sensor kinase